MTEKQVEKYLNDAFNNFAGDTRKFVSPGRTGVPDRICILKGHVFFVEVKKPLSKPTPPQWREIVRLKMLGCVAGYVSCKAEVDEFLVAPNMRLWMDNHVAKNVNLSKLTDDQRQYMQMMWGCK